MLEGMSASFLSSVFGGSTVLIFLKLFDKITQIIEPEIESYIRYFEVLVLQQPQRLIDTVIINIFNRCLPCKGFKYPAKMIAC